jgi:hypothetical protein
MGGFGEELDRTTHIAGKIPDKLQPWTLRTINQARK